MKKISVYLLCMALITSFVMFGCVKPEVTSEPDSEVEESFQSEITFNGSSTLAPVISKLATEFTENYTTWDKVDSSYPEKNIAIYVASGGSSAGIKSVIEKTSDFGMSARNVKDEEKEKIQDYKEFLLGIDALTISVNPENPILQTMKSLSTEQLMKIFSGEYKLWSDLDSSLPSEEIVVVTRDLGGGAHEVFQKSIMGDTEVRQDAIQAPSMGALVTKIIENKNAIGYASFGVVNQNKGSLVPLLVDDIEANEENILNGSYKISRPLVVLKSGELTPVEKTFMDYLKSSDSIKIIEEMGFVPAQ